MGPKTRAVGKAETLLLVAFQLPSLEMHFWDKETVISDVVRIVMISAF